GPVPCCIRRRFELLGERFILGNRNTLFIDRPFAPTQHTIEAPMNEHAEFCFPPPLHAGLVIRRRTQLFLVGGIKLSQPAGSHFAGTGQRACAEGQYGSLTEHRQAIAPSHIRISHRVLLNYEFGYPLMKFETGLASVVSLPALL